MRLCYLDSSALIKRYAAEPGSAWLDATVFAPADVLVLTSRVTIVEVWSALARRRREASVSARNHQDALSAFREDCATRYRFVEFETAVIEEAGRLLERHVLRAYDAVQLASALVAGAALTGAGLAPPSFVCADGQLLAVAQAEGIPTDNPSQHP